MEGDFAKLGGHKDHRQILLKFLQYRVPKAGAARISDIIDRCVKKKLSSAAALDELGAIHASAVASRGSEESTYDDNRVAARIRDLEIFKGKLDSPDSYLDIGCGNGLITAGLGKHFGLTEDKIFGADISTWAGHDHKDESLGGFTFKTIDVGTPAGSKYSIDLPSGSFSLISMLMVLHHVKPDQLPLVFEELRRLIKPTGLILIREHDSPNDMVDSLINIEHGVFEVVLEKLTDGSKFGQNYFGAYRTKREWVRVFEQYGFSLVATGDHKGATRGYYSLFQSRGLEVAPIESKTTPDLMKELLAIGATGEVTGLIRNDDDIKKMIIGGRREVEMTKNAINNLG